MILFSKKPKFWPASFVPKALQSAGLLGIVTKAHPAILLNKNCTAENAAVRLPFIIGRAELLNPLIAQKFHLCACCRKLLMFPKKTRMCKDCASSIKKVTCVIACGGCKKNFERPFHAFITKIRQGLENGYCNQKCMGKGYVISGTTRQSPCKNCGNKNKPNQNKYCNATCYHKYKASQYRLASQKANKSNV